MINKIYNLYFEDLSIFKYVNKKRLYLKCILPILLFAFMIYELVIYKLLTLLFIPTAITGFLLLIIINFEIKKVLEAEYKIKSNSLLYNAKSYENFRKNKLKKFLYENNILYNPRKIEFLIKNIEEQIQESKTPSIINWSIVLAIFIPLYSTFLQWIYKNVDSINTGVTIFITIITIMIVLVFVIYSFKLTFYNNGFSKYQENLRKLKKMLKDFYFNTID